MAGMRRQKPPKLDAFEYAAKGTDKTYKLDVRFINSVKGRGVFATANFQKGEFVVEYRGELIKSEVADKRRRIYHQRCTVFMYDFKWLERTWCIDASREDGSLGRLVNDDHVKPNCKMKRIISDGKPHLFLFALRDIIKGEEITYDYGGCDWPWRTSPAHVAGIVAQPISPAEEALCVHTQVEDQPILPAESPDQGVSGLNEQHPNDSLPIHSQVEDQPILPAESPDQGVSGLNEQHPNDSLPIHSQVEDQPILPAESPDQGVSGLNEQHPNDSLPIHSQFHSLEVASSEQDQPFVPRLRRTKSIKIDNQFNFDSDELYDSADSGEEYIPETSGDSSVETDRSENLDLFDDQTVFLNTLDQSPKIVDEVPVKGCSPTKVFNRGRSPSKQVGSSSKKRKRRHMSHESSLVKRNSSLSQSEWKETPGLTEDSAPDVKQNLPDSTSYQLDSTDKCSLHIIPVSKKEDGSRIFNKKQYCVYCKLGVIKMARHLERAHKDKPDVALAISFPKGSKERKMHFEHLRNKGNFAHNVEALKVGAGNLVPRKLPKQDCEAQEFMHCVYCQGLFRRKTLWRHLMSCEFLPCGPQRPGKTRVQALCSFAVPPPPGVKEELWKLLSNMVQDDVCRVVKADTDILEYGQHLYNRLGHDVGKHEYIRQKLRELGRLLIASRASTPLKTVEDHIKPSNFMHVVEAVKCVAGHDSKTDSFKRPSLALKIGHSLTKISMLVESRAHVQNNYSAAKEARAFRKIYQSRWNEMISSSSIRTLQESRWNAPLLLPFTKDVQALHSYLDEKQQDLCKKLSAKSSSKTWAELSKVTLTQVILFNRRRAGEVSKMPISAYLSQSLRFSDSEADVSEALSDLEKKLCQHFRRVEIRGKRGRKVPVLLTPEMQRSLDILVSKREDCEVPQGNPYLFARPSAYSSYRGSDCLRYFAHACGAKSPQNLTSTKLRKQTGTLSQVLNLSNTELDQLADFLGHDIRVHRQFYRLPEGTLQLAKISKVLLALEQGRLAEFKGRTLEEINIDPDENAYMESDTEELQDADLPKGPLTPTEKDKNEMAASDVRPAGESTKVPLQNMRPHVAKKAKEGPLTPTEKDKNETAASDVRPADESTKVPLQNMRPHVAKKAKGKSTFIRRKWTNEEVHAVEKHMMPYINSLINSFLEKLNAMSALNRKKMLSETERGCQ